MGSVLKERVLLLWMLLIYRTVPCNCDRLDFNYHSFQIGQDCTTINWIYDGETCIPVSFSLQAFKLEAVTSRHLASPYPYRYHNFTSLNSSSTTFSFPTEAFAATDEDLYFRVVALDAEATVCNPNGLLEFYSFTTPLETGPNKVCLSQHHTSYCIAFTRVPTVIWPKSPQSADSYCYCLAHSAIFSSCSLDCASTYQLVMRDDTICLEQGSSGMLVPRNEVLKVYFTFRSDPCSGHTCAISSITAVYQFTQLSFCNNYLSETSANGRNNWFYTEQNYTSIFDGSQTSSLFINITYIIPPQLLIWKHNGSTLDFNSTTRISGREQLLFHSVVLSDAGHYALTASSGAQCQSSGFAILVEYLNISVMVPERNSYTCIANGYPDVQLVGWQTGIGATTLQNLIQQTTTMERFEFYSIVTSTLTVENTEQCRDSRGYRCLFTKGGVSPAVKSDTIHCIPGPPGQLEVTYLESNNSVCFFSYSHPEYPVQYSLVNITINNHETETVHNCAANLTMESGSNCFFLDDCNGAGNCKTLHVLGMATNSLGSSAVRTEILITDNPFCQNLLQKKSIQIQIHLSGISYCNEWENDHSKLMVLINQMLEYIRYRCGCDFPSFHFQQPRFMCFDDNPSHVTFRTSIVAHQDWNISELVSLVEDWKVSEAEITIQEYTLLVTGEACPVKISTFEEPECSASSTQMPINKNAALIVGVSMGTAVLLAAVIVLVACLFAFHWKRNNTAATNQLSCDSPFYEEIPAFKVASDNTNLKMNPIIIYEEVQVKNDDMKYTQCDAYEKVELQVGVKKNNYSGGNLPDAANDSIYHLTICSAYGNRENP